MSQDLHIKNIANPALWPRLILLCAALLVATLPKPATAMTPVEQAQAFATCAGRFSAIATRQGASRDPNHLNSRQIVMNFMSLLDATRPYTDAAGIAPTTLRQWRASGWMEMSHLLRLQKRHADTPHAQHAERTIMRRLTSCRSLIL